MNFEELKKDWDNETTKDFDMNYDLEKKREASTIIDNVRKLIKNDLWYVFKIIIAIIVCLIISQTEWLQFFWILTCNLVLLGLILSVLIKFYKSSYNLDCNSLKNINWFYYNYGFSINIFKGYIYIAFILVYMLSGVYLMTNTDYSLGKWFVFNHIGMAIAFPLIIYFTVEKYIKKRYVPALCQLKSILEELES